MATQSIDREGTVGEMGIRELGGGALDMPSFSDPGTSYEVHPDSGHCTCPRYKNSHYCVKHPVLGEAVLKVRRLRFGKRLAEDKVIDLCLSIFAPIKNETRLGASDLFRETFTYKHSTPRMRLEAYRRYRRADLLESIYESRSA